MDFPESHASSAVEVETVRKAREMRDRSKDRECLAARQVCLMNSSLVNQRYHKMTIRYWNGRITSQIRTLPT